MAQVDWWPVDKVILGYLAATGGLLLAFWSRVPDAAGLFALHVAGAVLVVLAARFPSRLSWIFRHWYPLPYVAACYKEMSILIPTIRGVDLDRPLADLDRAIWGMDPTVWLERIQTPLLTETLQILYSLFVPAVLLVAVILWRRGRYAEFRTYAFLIAAGFLVSYAGYLAVPARGPRFLLAALQHVPLRGLWLYEALRVGLDKLESAHYDCFPSGHTELTVLAWWGSRLISRRLWYTYFGYTLSIVFATVYLRYHYTVDVMAGLAVAAALVVLAPRFYTLLGDEGAAFWKDWRSYQSGTGKRGSSF